jgi:uncharacterized cupredoxin-like copper-binding protein
MMHDGVAGMPKVTPLVAVIALLLATSPALMPVRAHEDHGAFSAGEPGDPKKPARIIKVRMIEEGKKMLFEPGLIRVHRGEQIRFILDNTGDEDHEFVLATIPENQKHAELMKKYSDMEHDDPNGKRVRPYGETGELLWRFTERGEFEYACLMPGHYEAGMHGKIIVN